MSVPSVLCTVQELESRLGRPLSAEEALRAPVVIRDISAAIRTIAPRIPTTLPLPDLVVAIASHAAISALAIQPGDRPVVQESLGGYSATFSTASDSSGLLLTDTQMQLLRPWRTSSIGSMSIAPTSAVVI